MGKYGKIIYYAIVVVLVLIFFGMILSGKDYEGAEMGLYIVLALGVIGLIAIIFSTGKFLIENPSNAKKMLITIGSVALACVICYVVAPGNLSPGYEEYGVTTKVVSKRIDMGLYLSAFLTFAAVGSIIVSEGISLFRD
jgi:hypothetical protein